MLPVLMAAACLAFVASVIVYAYRLRQRAYAPCELDEDDDDDGDDDDGATTETESLMEDAASSFLDPKATPSMRTLAVLNAVRDCVVNIHVTRPTLRSPRRSGATKRRHTTSQKFHKPHFYPLLDETVQWYANWEASKHHSPQENAMPSPKSSVPVDGRIEARHGDASESIYPRHGSPIPSKGFTAGPHSGIAVQVNS